MWPTATDRQVFGKQKYILNIQQEYLLLCPEKKEH
jgi:hypothetical protein